MKDDLIRGATRNYKRTPRGQRIEFKNKKTGDKYIRINADEFALDSFKVHKENEPEQCMFVDCTTTGKFTMKLLAPFLLLLMSFSVVAEEMPLTITEINAETGAEQCYYNTTALQLNGLLNQLNNMLKKGRTFEQLTDSLKDLRKRGEEVRNEIAVLKEIVAYRKKKDKQ